MRVFPKSCKLNIDGTKLGAAELLSMCRADAAHFNESALKHGMEISSAAEGTAVLIRDDVLLGAVVGSASFAKGTQSASLLRNTEYLTDLCSH